MSTRLLKEYHVFCFHLEKFLKEHPEEFVLIKGNTIVDFYPTCKEALENGLERFGNVPFLIKHVREEEEVHLLHYDIF